MEIRITILKKVRSHSKNSILSPIAGRMVKQRFAKRPIFILFAFSKKQTHDPLSMRMDTVRVIVKTNYPRPGSKLSFPLPCHDDDNPHDVVETDFFREVLNYADIPTLKLGQVVVVHGPIRF